MLFRNLRFYEYTGRHRPRTSRLVEQLAVQAFEACRPHQAESVGWAVPDGSDDSNLVLEIGNRQLASLQVEQRPVPAAVVRDEVERRARAARNGGGLGPGRRELADLRDTVIADLRPRAFSRTRRHPLMIDAEAGLILTNAITTSASDRLFEAVRGALGNLPMRLPVTGKPVAQTLTRWARGGRLPKAFVTGTTATLRDPRNRQRVVRVRGVDDLPAELAAHLDGGYEVVELELVWADRLRLRLCEDLSLRGLALLTDEAAAPPEAETDPAAEFAAAALVESAVLVKVIGQLTEALGVVREQA